MNKPIKWIRGGLGAALFVPGAFLIWLSAIVSGEAFSLNEYRHQPNDGDDGLSSRMSAARKGLAGS